MTKDSDGDVMWLSIDERTDVLSSLSLSLMCLNGLEDNPALWKWAILSLHNALQGAMVCHLSGTAQVGASSDKSAYALLDWYERDRRGEIERVDEGFDELGVRKSRIQKKEDYPPSEYLADAKELFKRLYSESERREEAGEVLSVTQSERDSFRRLHDLRNGLSHFTPKGWSIELNGLPGIFLDILSVLEMISSDQWPFRHMREEERARLKRLLGQLRKELEQMRETHR